MLSPAPEDRSRCDNAASLARSLEVPAAAMQLLHKRLMWPCHIDCINAAIDAVPDILAAHGRLGQGRPPAHGCSESPRCSQDLPCRCTTPADQLPDQIAPPETSNLRVALQDFRLNPCTSRDGPPNSTELATAAAKLAEQDVKPACKARGQKDIADFFRRSSGAERADGGHGLAPSEAMMQDARRTSGARCHPLARDHHAFAIWRVNTQAAAQSYTCQKHVRIDRQCMSTRAACRWRQMSACSQRTQLCTPEHKHLQRLGAS